MIFYAEEFAKREFTAATMKQAYIKANKWFATNVLAKDELHNIHVEYEKHSDKQYPTVTIRLYVTVDEKEVESRHCKICKESHKNFYGNSFTDCNWCKMKAYQNRLEESIKVKRNYYTKILEQGTEALF